MRLLLVAALLLLWTTAAFAQDDTGTANPAPAPGVPQDPTLPPDADAPLIVGKDIELPGPPVVGQPACECCGKYWDQSPTRVEAVVARGGEKELVHYESMACMLRDTGKEGNGLVRFRILDYTTAGTEKEVMLDGSAAYYVYGARPLPGSSAPYIAAFADEQHAQEAMSWLDGEASLSYGGLLKRYQADMAAKVAQGDSDLPIDAVIPPGEDYYVCSCAAGDCDDVRSDAAGVCPKCGLDLVHRSEKLALLRQRALAGKESKDAGSKKQ